MQRAHVAPLLCVSALGASLPATVARAGSPLDGSAVLSTAVAAAAAVERAAAVTRKPGRVFSVAHTTFIREAPSAASTEIGYVRVGTSVARRSGDIQLGPGCAGGFVGVEPRGWVCLDRAASLERDDRYSRAMELAQPGDAPLPFRYALSNGTPMYRRLPTADEAAHAERFLGAPGAHAPLSWGNRGHERLAESRAIASDGDVPFFLADGGSAGRANPLGLVRRHIPLGSMLAYTRAFSSEGRTWLFSSDGTVVPADRVRAFRGSAFEGVTLGAGVELPIAWIRGRAAAKLVRGADGDAVATGETWPEKAFVPLVDGEAGDGVLAAKDGTLLAERDATVVRKRPLPVGVSERDKWLVVSIGQGTLVAYEGLTPVFATLVSPGVGGPPHPGKSAVETSSTPLGVFRVTYKHVAATMSPEKGEDRSFWIADVPYTQYFHAPFALHVAYWHEDFGRPMSAGCVNVSPRDGKRLFEWTEPHVPEGWNGALAGGENGPGTFISVVR